MATGLAVAMYRHSDDGRHSDLVVSAELIRDILQCKAILAHVRRNDLVVGRST
jgi:hypothetical protein